MSNKVVDQFRAERTPEVFVLDQNRNVRHRGRIDDQCGVGHAREKSDRHELKVASEELLTNKEVSLPENEAIGCHLGRVSIVESAGDITYSNQISRLFNKRRLASHRDGEIAPFTVSSYEDILGWEAASF